MLFNKKYLVNSVLSFIFVVAVIPKAFSANILCKVNNQGEHEFQNQLDTVLNEKVRIGATTGVRAYVTEKKNQLFEVEGFAEDLELRFYAEAPMKQSQDRVTATIWSRDQLLEITCWLP